MKIFSVLTCLFFIGAFGWNIFHDFSDPRIVLDVIVRIVSFVSYFMLPIPFISLALKGENVKYNKFSKSILFTTIYTLIFIATYYIVLIGVNDEFFKKMITSPIANNLISCLIVGTFITYILTYYIKDIKKWLHQIIEFLGQMF